MEPPTILVNLSGIERYISSPKHLCKPYNHQILYSPYNIEATNNPRNTQAANNPQPPQPQNIQQPIRQEENPHGIPAQPQAPKQEQQPQNQNQLPCYGMILHVCGGSALEFKSKRKKKEHFRRVNSVLQEGPIVKSGWSKVSFTFTEQDLSLSCYPHTDAMVIKALISGWLIGKILVDNRSSVDIIFSSTFDKMKLDRKLLQPSYTPLYGFGGKRVEALGKISLPMTFRTTDNARSEFITFDVVEMNYPYNVILGRGFLNKFEAVVHQACLRMKMPSVGGVIIVFGDQKMAQTIEQGITPGQKNVKCLQPKLHEVPQQRTPRALP